jgi:hypothetical protein
MLPQAKVLFDDIADPCVDVQMTAKVTVSADLEMPE